MNTQSIFEGLISNLDAGLSSPSEDQPCARSFEYKGKIPVTLAVSDDGTLYYVAQIMDLDQTADAELFKQILKINHLGIKTKGSILSIDPAESKVILSLSESIADVSSEAFVDKLTLFLERSESAQNELEIYLASRNSAHYESPEALGAVIVYS